jgi:hypothetical protein
VALSFGKIDCK